LGNVQLAAPSTLSTGGNTFNYATVYFVPTNTATYKFGQTSAPVDTVMIVYAGIFNSATPGTGALAGNDDTSQATHQTTTGNNALVTNCGLASRCPQVSTSVTAGQRYTILISTFAPNTALGLPLSFYSDGAGNFYANVAALSPSVSVLTSSSNLQNSPALPGARVIDANSNLLNLFSGLSGDQQISNAASQTLPLLMGGSMVAAQSALGGINRVIQARIEGNRGMSSGDDFYGDKNVWFKPFGSWADQNDRNGVAGYKANTYGMAFGLDGAISPVIRLGAAFAYAKSDVNGQSSVAPQSADVSVYQLIGYGSYALDERTEVNFQADFGQNANKGRRQIAFTSTTATSDYDSYSGHMGIGLGRAYPLSAQTSLTPSVRVDYTWIKDKAYSEQGAGLLNLNVDSRTTQALVISANGKVSHQLNDQTMLTANLGVGYDTMSKQAAITSAFAGAPSAAFVTYGIDPSPWIAQAGVGAVYKTKSGLELSGRYDLEYRESFLNQTASIKARWAF
jgi:outer membrane autotransporter protein